MNIHKFNTKPKTTPPKTIHWHPLREVKYPALKINSMTWEIFSQEDIKLKSKEDKQLQLGLYNEPGSCFIRISELIKK